MFSKVLIANRGEIAVRVIRTCKELGISTVAVYSDLDSDSLHTSMADEAYSLGGKTAAESYLNTDAIIDAIKKSGADAVHPGYGFYSENADFARQLTDLGITFIGPSPEVLEVMGDKLSARKVSDAAGVSSIPGTADAVTTAEQVEAFGKEFGWPVAIKAAYGGGGRGMKMVLEGEAQEALESATRESLAYFGRDELYVERYLTWPRHVEVQLLADSHGNCIYLGTRDCSVQRRHQKLIEEAPAPGIDEKILKKMGEAAVAIAKKCNYENAGTIEFLYEDGEFYFLEMNTRLQVEHPATEAICGIDLVAEQLLVASGEPLRYSQSDIELKGHSIEIRINAEDPANGSFLPSPGPIDTLKIPNGFFTRFDSGYEAGSEISEYYDNLVGKLICWGEDRDKAIQRTIRALEELVVEPIATTKDAQLEILRHPDFQEIKHSTRWLSEKVDLSNLPAKVNSASNAANASVQDRKSLEVEVNGKRYSVTLWGDDLGSAAPQQAKRKKPTSRSTQTSTTGKASDGDVVAPMQGTIVKVALEVGATVEVGDTILVLEAMKMENNVMAETAGTIEEIKVAVGDTVGSGDSLATIK